MKISRSIVEFYFLFYDKGLIISHSNWRPYLNITNIIGFNGITFRKNDFFSHYTISKLNLAQLSLRTTLREILNAENMMIKNQFKITALCKVHISWPSDITFSEKIFCQNFFLNKYVCVVMSPSWQKELAKSSIFFIKRSSKDLIFGKFFG